MSDEPTPAQPAAPVTTAPPAKPANAWGQPISAERQAELRALAERQRDWAAQPEAERGKSAFEGVRLSGADVSWLAEQSGRNRYGELPNLHLEGADLGGAHLEGADLNGAYLEGANLRFAYLEGAGLIGAYLEGANLRFTHLEGAGLIGAYLEGANLGEAHLEGANLRFAHLEGTDLRGAWLDSKTVPSEAMLDTNTRLGDIQWSGVGAVNLTRINWSAVPILGDERGVNLLSPVEDHEAAVRAYRQLAAQLRTQGMSEVADRFADRAQVRQRKLLFRQMLEDWRYPWRLPGDLARWLFSWFLALLAGYGYHPGRSVFWYLATITGFAFTYYKTTSGWIPFGLPHPSSFAPLTWYEALVLSVSSFHGRGFLPFPNLGDPVTILAAIEAVFGLLIEISFIATFTQRFFGSK